MRPLSPTLLEAQMGANFRPHVKVEVDNALPGVAHPTYTRLYDGTEPSLSTCPIRAL